MQGKVLEPIYRCERILELVKTKINNGKKELEVNVFVLDSCVSDLLKSEKSWYQVRQLTGEDKGRVFNVLEEWGDDFFALHINNVHMMINGHSGLFIYEQLVETNAERILGKRATLTQIEAYKLQIEEVLNSRDKQVLCHKNNENGEMGE